MTANASAVRLAGTRPAAVALLPDALDESWRGTVGGSTAVPEQHTGTESRPRTLGQLIRDYAETLVSTASAHTMVPRIGFPIVIVPPVERVETVGDGAGTVEAIPEIPQLRDAMTAIEAITGLPKYRVAELLGVSRVAYYDWRRGKNISIENLQRVLGTFDVLRRASSRFSDVRQVQGWLYTAVGSRAVTPAQLLGSGHVDEARMLAITSLPTRSRPVPDWLSNAPEDAWTARERRRKDRVVLASSEVRRGEPGSEGEESQP
jgi:hypothetical protein